VSDDPEGEERAERLLRSRAAEEAKAYREDCMERRERAAREGLVYREDIAAFQCRLPDGRRLTAELFLDVLPDNSSAWLVSCAGSVRAYFTKRAGMDAFWARVDEMQAQLRAAAGEGADGRQGPT
jgi:hypothetical protein